MTYDLKKDHASIKKQIKDWEGRIDHIVALLPINSAIANELEDMSHEMSAINI